MASEEEETADVLVATGLKGVGEVSASPTEVAEQATRSQSTTVSVMQWPCVWLNGSHTIGDCVDDYTGFSKGLIGNDTGTSNYEASDDGGSTNVTDIYQAWAPVIIFFCVLTFIFNVFIVVAARWMRRPITPTMYFSLSLAAADAIASLNVGLGLVFHRYCMFANGRIASKNRLKLVEGPLSFVKST